MNAPNHNLNLSLCPGCEKSFRPKHGNQVFCSYKCNEVYYNRNHRDKSKNYLGTLSANVELLQSLTKEVDEVVVSIAELEERGFDFMVYSDRYCPPSDRNKYFVTYGDFITNLTENESIILKLK